MKILRGPLSTSTSGLTFRCQLYTGLCDQMSCPSQSPPSQKRPWWLMQKLQGHGLALSQHVFHRLLCCRVKRADYRPSLACDVLTAGARYLRAAHGLQISLLKITDSICLHRERPSRSDCMRHSRGRTASSYKSFRFLFLIMHHAVTHLDVFWTLSVCPSSGRTPPSLVLGGATCRWGQGRRAFAC